MHLSSCTGLLPVAGAGDGVAVGRPLPVGLGRGLLQHSVACGSSGTVRLEPVAGEAAGLHGLAGIAAAALVQLAELSHVESGKSKSEVGVLV